MWDPTTERLSREDLKSLQSSRLRAQVERVHNASPFYRRKFREAGISPAMIQSVDDIRRVPFTTKDELRASQQDRLPYGEHVSAPAEDIVWLGTTSGTSGTPLVLPRTAHDIQVWTDLTARAFATAGIGKGDIFQNILAYSWVLSGTLLHLGAQKAGAAAINAGVGNTEKQLWALQNLGTTALHATPSYLNHLGQLLAGSGANEHLKLRTIISGGEVGMGTKEGKDQLRELFPTVETFADVGGATDIGTMIWAECPLMTGGHFAEDSVFWEVLDPDTLEPVGPGEPGELVVTDLVSTGAPLLRYRLRDIVRFETDPCACGRTTARMPDGILGRSDDMVTVRSANVFPSTIDAIVKSISKPRISDYQLVIDRPVDLDRATLRIQFDGDVESTAAVAVEKELASRIQLAGGGRFEIQTVPPGTLPVFVYKAMRVIDERKGQKVSDAYEVARRQSQG